MPYCFLDLETTGLDPDKDEILEISWMFTDSRFNVTYMPRTFLVSQRDWQTTWNLIRTNPVVEKMHSESGLLAALANEDVEKVSLDDIYFALERDLARESVGGLIHLAGRSVHFDKGMLLSEDFETLFDDSQPVSFHHRMLDISAVNLFLASSGVETQHLQVVNNSPHRAMHDILADVQYMKNVSGYVREIFEEVAA